MLINTSSIFESIFFLLLVPKPFQQHSTCKPCTNTTSQCLPDQRCSSSIGRYGSTHVLSAQGCLDKELCGSHEIVSYRGVKYNVSHTCCCRDKCNNELKFDTSLKKLLGMIGGTSRMGTGIGGTTATITNQLETPTIHEGGEQKVNKMVSSLLSS
uniref:UPAR/Ly6 domain-containing protein n=1 Tax=Acanthochromis polyacanthus TaxID=80966 RepID=A0A3Q1GH03_9TELE